MGVLQHGARGRGGVREVVCARAYQHGPRLVRFGLVGLTGVLVNTILLYVGADVAGLPHVVAVVLATELAIVSNFVLNDRWTFLDVRAHHSTWRRLGAYNGIALGGMGISLGVFLLLADMLHIYYLLANLWGVAAATLWNYGINTRVTWRAPGAADSANLSEPMVQGATTGRRQAP